MPIHSGGRFPNLLANTVTRGDFEELGRRIGLVPRLVKRELDMFATEQPLAKDLIRKAHQKYAEKNYKLSFLLISEKFSPIHPQENQIYCFYVPHES